MRNFNLVVGGMFAAVLLVLSAPTVAAQSSGIGLSPSLIESGAEVGEVLSRTLTVTNLSANEETYFLYTRDIAGVENGGSPIFANDTAQKTGYELSEWVSLDKTEITLPAGADTTIGLTITVPESATPGSHFGGIFVSKEPPRLRQSGAGIGYQVANIVSIRIAGDVLESAQIRSLSTNQIIYGTKEVVFNARIENKGNVLIRPFGPLEIYNMFGDRVAAVDMNDTQSAIFPQTVRDFELTWSDSSLGFGRYEAVASMVYGEQGRAQSTMTGSVSFWILPMAIIKPALIALGVILLISYIAIRAYVNSKVRNMAGSRRLVRRQQQRGPSMLLLVSIVMLAVTVLFLIILLALFA